jgi:hypothetical protein
MNLKVVAIKGPSSGTKHQRTAPTMNEPRKPPQDPDNDCWTRPSPGPTIGLSTKHGHDDQPRKMATAPQLAHQPSRSWQGSDTISQQTHFFTADLHRSRPQPDILLLWNTKPQRGGFRFYLFSLPPESGGGITFSVPNSKHCVYAPLSS